MKLKRLLFPFFACIVAGVFFLQCTRCTPLTDTQFKEPVTLVTYNAQTFFDAVEDGTEFKEYKGSKSRWTDQKYRARLGRLKDTIFTAGEKLTGKKDRLPDKNNPNWLEPDIILTIPSIRGEKRSGLYDPAATYTTLPPAQKTKKR